MPEDFDFDEFGFDEFVDVARDADLAALAREMGIELDPAFHDLIHRPFGRICFRQSGGPIRHLASWWKYQGRDELRRQGPCRLHWHTFVPVDVTSPHTPDRAFACRGCGMPLSPGDAAVRDDGLAG